MKFFIPNAKDDAQAEGILTGIKKFAKETTGWDMTDRRIFSIGYRHDGKDLFDEIGKPDPITKEIVIAILESNAYLVCTPNRGVLRGGPMLVGKSDAYSVIDFE